MRDDLYAARVAEANLRRNFYAARLSRRFTSQSIDKHIEREGQAPTFSYLLRQRFGKLAEELGEIEAAIVAWEGSNPRKPGGGSLEDVVKEALDLAAGALFAIESLTGYDGTSQDRLSRHIHRLHARLFDEAD